jgi:hypothetical protein
LSFFFQFTHFEFICSHQKFTRRIGERRPSYQILGLLIMIQLFVSTVQAARERLAKIRTAPSVAPQLEE